MASINSSQHAENDFPGDDVEGEEEQPAYPLGRRRKRRTRHRSRFSLRLEKVAKATDGAISGWPELEGLKPVLSFLAMPAFLVLALTITGGGWPKAILYPIAMGLGLIVALSALKGVELVLACMIIYLPFSKVFVVPLAPGVNGTNMLILLGMFAAALRATSLKQKLTDFPPGTVLVAAFGFITALSAITITFLPGGRTYFLYTEILSYKAWVDQFIFYFIALMCVRDVESAKRCVVYMMIGSMLVVLYSVPEMLDKMGRSTIEKSRIEGPHLQSNNFGGFVAYTLLPLIAVFVIYIKDVRAWLLTPYFLLTAKVLITTFSRGAYLAMVAGGLMAGWFKGKGFLAFWGTIMLCFLLIFPSLIPESITARMDSLTNNSESSAATTEEQLDKSSSVRLVMWHAAAVMIMEDPVWGKGFKGFPFVKKEYTETVVEESDPHSMYLYIGSQMGLPALAMFLLILAYSFTLGRRLSRNKEDRFIKAIGIGGASATACYAVVCVFGSRAVSLNFTAYFWAYLVAMQVISYKLNLGHTAQEPKSKRNNAFEDMASREAAEQMAAIEADAEIKPDHDPSKAEAKPEAVSKTTQRKRNKGLSGRRKKPTRGAQAHQARISGQADSRQSSDSSQDAESSQKPKRRKFRPGS